jgi:hypothetical protein
LVANEELERLRSCVRRSRPFARRRHGAADGAAAGLGINAARSVAAKKSIACGKGDGFAAVGKCPRSVPLQPSSSAFLAQNARRASPSESARPSPPGSSRRPRGVVRAVHGGQGEAGGEFAGDTGGVGAARRWSIRAFVSARRQGPCRRWTALHPSWQEIQWEGWQASDPKF